MLRFLILLLVLVGAAYADGIDINHQKKTITFPAGTAPSVNGQMGYDGTNFVFRQGGVNVNLGGFSGNTLTLDPGPAAIIMATPTRYVTMTAVDGLDYPTVNVTGAVEVSKYMALGRNLTVDDDALIVDLYAHPIFGAANFRVWTVGNLSSAILSAQDNGAGEATFVTGDFNVANRLIIGNLQSASNSVTITQANATLNVTGSVAVNSDAGESVSNSAGTLGRQTVVLMGTSTNNSSPQELTRDNSGAVFLPTVTVSQTVAYEVHAVVRGTAGTNVNKSAHYILAFTAENSLGVTTLLNSALTVVSEEVAAWDFTVVADDTNDRPAVRFTGDAATTVKVRGWADLVGVR